MAVKKAEHEPIEDFDDWYTDRSENPRTGCLEFRNITPKASSLWSRFEGFKREHQSRVANYWKYETLADAEVVSKKPDLPNVSSGEIAGIVRRTARTVVQHTPNVKVISEFGEDDPKGILAQHILKTKIIGDDLNSNVMQQNLFASVMSSFTLGFEAVTPVLVQKADRTWCMDYDVIHYQDFFPEPGVKDARKSPEVFIRRYLTKGEVHQLIGQQQPGWDIAALRALAQSNPPARQKESNSHQGTKHGQLPDGYEIITWYSTSGDPFLTFDANSKMLLRIEKNKDPLKRHPVQMLVLEKDPQQPLGKSQISLVFGRQEFQDLMLNGAMKLWYKNINPTLIGYGTGLNGVPNMSPGKYTNIPNPNAKVEAFEVNTQTLMQFGSISQQNMGSMVNLIGAADQQMAQSAGANGQGMSATPQGVDAQEKMVDITTNNYQKAVENFFSAYCSYSLTVYFQEMKNVRTVKPTAAVRKELIAAGVPVELFSADGELMIDMKDMAVTYDVQCVPGSLVEMEDEKQLRILNELFVPLSQALPAIVQSQDPEMIRNSVAAMQFIIRKQIELSGSAHADNLTNILTSGVGDEITQHEEKVRRLETGIGELNDGMATNNAAMASGLQEVQGQVAQLTENFGVLLEKLGVTSEPSASAGAGVPMEMPATPLS